MPDSPFLEKDRVAGKALLKEKKVGHVLFSEGTYQVEVIDPKVKEPYWPFLQLDDDGNLLDCFCTCAAAERKKSCPHLAAAYERIFHGKDEPLHVRFRESLWNQLCQLASRRHGYDTQILKKDGKGGYEACSVTGKRLFFMTPLHPKGKVKLDEIILHRPVETEETSLKFSKLSAEELTLWKQGRPSHALRYELSFWSDLAKWWTFLHEDGEPYKIEFIYENDILPKAIVIKFSKIQVGFYISNVNWQEIIPALATVTSPLPVHEFPEQKIQKILYDEINRTFSLEFIPLEEKVLPPVIEAGPTSYEVGEWIFVPERGFFPARQDPLLQQSFIPQNKVGYFLNRHAKLIQRYLVTHKMHMGSLKARYHLFFDEKKSLHISCYVFEMGDLQKAKSAYFGPWVFVEDRGFYQLENLLFEEIEKIVPKAHVSDFVNRHRLWLQNFEGFSTHVSSVESHLTYTMTEDLSLRFDTQLEIAEEGSEIFDFGEWIYVKARGFYAKTTGRATPFLKPGLTIPKLEISRFIQTHREELEQIAGFFRSFCPLERAGLNISINLDGEIWVTPAYFYSAAYTHQTERMHILGNFVYVENEGFCEIPPDLRLPEKYTQKKRIEKKDELDFVTFELEALKQYILLIDPRLHKPKELYLRINGIKKDDKTKAGGWVLDLDYESEHGGIDVFDIWEGVNDKKKYIFSKAGLVMLGTARYNWLKGINKSRWMGKKRQVRLSTMELMRLNMFEDIHEPQGASNDAVESRRVLDEFRNFTTTEPIELKGLQSHLRPYQEIGVKWLWFLYVHGLSGLLCDEMGLGKTHQAMALLAAAINSQKEVTGKFLVVCPTSVIYHWQDLLQRFLPGARVLVFYGAQRKLEDFTENYDILLTSYGTLRSEKKALSDLTFEIAIYDEIQTAKNVHSQTHKAIRGIDSGMRLGLTGTPIENRLLELKALFDVVLPTYLPNEALFKELFIYPIEKNQDVEKKSLLAKLIKPFILRRKKAEVLLELPEKTEEISYCFLSDEQKELYRSTYLAYRDGLMSDLKDSAKPVPFMHIFALFSSLKQICDHPCLITKKYEDYKKHQSGKWELFVELLEETRESGQKMVVFSQYLDMLNIIEAYLKEHGIGFAGIRGSTRNRKQMLDNFRDDPKCEVFVASLQAAGVGIDLVAASVVIHYDRWWNPARENQATDRVHRMGQRRGVQVFKMVTKGTIEEHIHRLIEKKLELLEGVIGFDEQDQIKGLDRAELLELLKLLNHDIEAEGSS